MRCAAYSVNRTYGRPGQCDRRDTKRMYKEGGMVSLCGVHRRMKKVRLVLQPKRIPLNA